MTHLIPITRTKTDLPAVAETGGAVGKTKGQAVLFCRSNGARKIATFLPLPEETAEKGHAVFVLQNNDCVIEVTRSRTDSFSITIAQYTNVLSGNEAVFEVIHFFKSGKWDVIPPEHFTSVIGAAKEKSCQLECREPIWFERKVAPVQVPIPQRTVPRPEDCQFPVIAELVQTAPDEFSLGLSNGIQMLIHIKNLPGRR